VAVPMSSASTPRFLLNFWGALLVIVTLNVALVAGCWSVFFQRSEAAPGSFLSGLMYFLIVMAAPIALVIAADISARGSLESEQSAIISRRLGILCALFFGSTLAAAFIFRGESVGTTARSLLLMYLVVFVALLWVTGRTSASRAVSGLSVVGPELRSVYLQAGFGTRKGTDERTLGWLHTPTDELRKLLHAVALQERSEGLVKPLHRFWRVGRAASFLSLGSIFLFLAWHSFGGTIPSSGPLRTVIAVVVGSALCLIAAGTLNSAIKMFSDYRRLGSNGYTKREELKEEIRQLAKTEFPKLLEAHAAGEPLHTEHPLMVSSTEASADGGEVSR